MKPAKEAFFYVGGHPITLQTFASLTVSSPRDILRKISLNPGTYILSSKKQAAAPIGWVLLDRKQQFIRIKNKGG